MKQCKIRENNFGRVKRSPARIDALGMVLIIALMVYRLMQHMMRRFIQETKTLLPGWKNQDTDRPTTYILTWALRSIRVLRFDGQRVFAKPPDEQQRRYLEGLGPDQNVYLQPGLKCQPIIPAKYVPKGCGM
jgi:hypothetical protein